MAHTFTNLLVHLVFSTKSRSPNLTPDLQRRLFPYLDGIVANCGGRALCTNGPDDHVHMLLSMPTTMAMADLVRTIKANSSKWLHEEAGLSDFAWQTGYGAFSVSPSVAEKVKAYIQTQQDHHRSISFQDELVAFLERHGIEYDRRFIWE